MTEDNRLKEEQRLELNKSFTFNKDWKYEEVFPTISSYTTSYNCLKNEYPIIEAIKSFSWCDEIVVVDGGSTDGTLTALEELSKEIPQLQIYEIPIDWDCPGKDGQQKALSRAMCTSEYYIQFDADEICLGSHKKWKRAAKDMSSAILELPVLEPFGDISKLRLNQEHNPVKWRLFKAVSEITHGIPKHDQIEKDKKIFSKGMSDGCFPVHIVTEQMYPSRKTSLATQMKSTYGKSVEYEKVIEEIILQEEPCVLHLGHVDLEKKIRLFMKEWRFWWASLYEKDPNDLSMYWPKDYLRDKVLTPDDITEELVKQRVEELKRETPTVEIEALLKYKGLTNVSEGHTV